MITGRYLALSLPPAARCTSPSGHIDSCCGQDVLFSSSGQLCMNKSHRWLGHPRGRKDKKKSHASKKQQKLLCLSELSSWRKTNKTSIDHAFVSRSLSDQVGAHKGVFSGVRQRAVCAPSWVSRRRYSFPAFSAGFSSTERHFSITCTSILPV